MSDSMLPKMTCLRCRAALDAADNYCRRCGTPTANLPGISGGSRAATPWAAGPALDPSVQRPSWWESPWVVLSLLFLVLGPLALPMLWGSRRFTPLWKIILTVFVTLFTVFLIWRIWIAVQQTLASLGELQNLQF